MIIINKILRQLLLNFGYSIRKIKKNNGFNYTLEENSKIIKIESKIIEEIFNFFEKIKPFYQNNIRKELQIKGIWLEVLKKRRVNQIEYLTSGNKEAYSNLINNMLRNELVSGLWEVKYYNKNSIGKNVPLQFIHHLEIFKYITGFETDTLNDGNFGNKWGVNINNSLLTLADPYKGLNAFNAASYLNANCKNRAVYLDLGSGIGSDAIKVSKFTEMPTQIILCDIPLNLTTAFAYVSMNTNHKCVLVDTKDKISDLVNNDFSENEFIFIPTLFVEELAKKYDKIDLMFNHGSFSEMDYTTIDFYLNILLKNGPVRAMYEINSNKNKENTGGHTEVKSSVFPIPKSFKLIKRNMSFNSYFDHRYLESLYVKIE